VGVAVYGRWCNGAVSGSVAVARGSMVDWYIGKCQRLACPSRHSIVRSVRPQNPVSVTGAHDRRAGGRRPGIGVIAVSGANHIHSMLPQFPFVFGQGVACPSTGQWLSEGECGWPMGGSPGKWKSGEVGKWGFATPSTQLGTRPKRPGMK